MSVREGVGRWRLASDGRPRPDAPFGRGPMAARILAKVIDGAAWTGSRLPATVAHRLATIGGNLEWALRPAKRGVLATNLAHALAARPDSPVVQASVRREVVHEAHRSADLLWALGRPAEFLRSLEVEGILVRVVDCYSIKPIDAETLRDAVSQTGLLVTVEDHWSEGGLGDAVLAALADSGDLSGRVVKVAVTQMPGSGTPEELRDWAGISAAAIVDRVRSLLR